MVEIFRIKIFSWFGGDSSYLHAIGAGPRASGDEGEIGDG